MDREYRHIDRDAQERVVLDNLAGWEREHIVQLLNRDAAADEANRDLAARRLRYLEKCIEVGERLLEEIRDTAAALDAGAGGIE